MLLMKQQLFPNLSTLTKPQQRISDTLLHLCGLSLFIFLASFFVFTSSKAVNAWFYFAVVPLVILNSPRIAWPLLWHDGLFTWLLVYLAYCSVSACWSVDHHWTSSFRVLAQSFFTLIFLFAVYLALQLPQTFKVLLLKILLWIIMLSATISIIIWYIHHPLNTRLMGFFRVSQSITSDWVYGIPVLVSAYYLITKPLNIANIGLALLGLPPFIYILLTQSRGPLLALVFGVFVLMLCYRNWRSLLLLILFVVVVLFDHTMLSRSLDTFYFREAIWNNVLQSSLQYPWFGHGYSSTIKVQTAIGQFGHAHNAYLEIFFLGGIVGVILQSVLIVWVLLRGIHHRHQTHSYFYLAWFVFSLVCLASDGNRLIAGPHELWLSFWLPLFMILLMPHLSKRVINTSP